MRGITRNTPDTGIGSKWYEQAILDYTYQISLANDADALIDHLDMLVTAGRLTDEKTEPPLEITSIHYLLAQTSERKASARRDMALGLTPEFNTLY